MPTECPGRRVGRGDSLAILPVSAAHRGKRQTRRGKRGTTMDRWTPCPQTSETAPRHRPKDRPSTLQPIEDVATDSGTWINRSGTRRDPPLAATDPSAELQAFPTLIHGWHHECDLGPRLTANLEKSLSIRSQPVAANVRCANNGGSPNSPSSLPLRPATLLATFRCWGERLIVGETQR